MTDIELLPLPAALTKWLRRHTHEKDAADVANFIQDYARANVAHATAAKGAEIEATRAERDRAMGACQLTSGHLATAEARAEQLAEALRELLIDMMLAQSAMRRAAKTDPRWEGCAEAIQPRVDAAHTALRDHDQEVGE